MDAQSHKSDPEEKTAPAEQDATEAPGPPAGAKSRSPDSAEDTADSQATTAARAAAASPGAPRLSRPALVLALARRNRVRRRRAAIRRGLLVAIQQLVQNDRQFLELEQRIVAAIEGMVALQEAGLASRDRLADALIEAIARRRP
ncbi:uncharacterized protein LOC122383148 [Amphibalanus amphitrite]|uniref:uncharacterized protein LOC122383148 n=1 Tax=Amphibalanus amphitrite TaxID=1232801 RepID=UPI001C91EB20|nr:uncharacterized protein LOC122383148 [Amphibalanus amphitrite]